ncbi:hypothetical protein KR038_005230, partial [Drosophila bunnanda]
IPQMEDTDAQERFEYVLKRYNQVNINITGKPLGLHGKVVSHGSYEEEHIVFHYVDNTLRDVSQSCTFVLSTKPNKCESIRTYCSGFLSRPPRPLLKLEPLTVCEDEIRVGEPESEFETEPDAETVPERDPNAGMSAEAYPTKAPNDTKASLYN